MIVETMTPKEVYAELKVDIENVCRWWEHRRKELQRIHRYAERAGVKKDGCELIEYFLMNNFHGFRSSDKRMAGRTVRYNDKEHRCTLVKEGLLLGEIEDGIFIVKTFVTHGMTSGLQRDFVDQKADKIKNLEEEYKNLKALELWI